MTGLYRKPSFWIALAFCLAGLAGVAIMLFHDRGILGWVLLVYLVIAALVLVQHIFDTEKPKKRSIVRTSLLFAAMFVLSVLVSPLLGLIGVGTGQDWLQLAFAWPLYALFPFGLASVGNEQEYAVLPNAAIPGAIACWFFLSIMYGCIARKISLRGAALGAFPAMLSFAVVANLTLYVFGYVAMVPFF